MQHISTYDRIWIAIISVAMMIPVFLSLRAIYWPEKDFASEIIIPATDETVWPFLTAPDLRTSWEAGLTDVLPSLGEAGKAGSRAFVFYYINGKRVEAEEELVSVEPFTAIDKIIRFDSHTKWISYRLDGADGTRISYRETILYQSFKDRFWAPVTLWGRQRTIRSMLERLKQRAAG